MPVINVNWDEAQQYAAWLSKMTGRTYRLLTEAEWEYAARAGTATAFFWGDEIGNGNANCQGCGGRWKDMKPVDASDPRRRFGQPSPVGSFKPNAFGLYDMAGNVWQWVQDCYQDNYNGAPADGSARTDGDCSRHVARGGSWLLPLAPRSALRTNYSTQYRLGQLGFRVARTLIP